METILILDKEPHIQWTLKTFLEEERYVVTTTSTLSEALRNFSELKVSGLITEYWINEVSAIETIKELKRVLPEVYVMMLTNNDVKESEYEEIMNSGVDDYFLKPCSFKKILLHLRKGLRHQNILLRKNELEDELKQLKKRGDIQENRISKRTN
jgi:DNA-binding response OmpR family regulator